MSESINFSEAEVQALKDLMDVAVQLKKSGLLGMLKAMLEDTEGAMAGLQADTSLLRLGVLVGALFEAARRLESEEIALLKMNTEDAAYCLLEGLAKTKPAEAEPKGMMGLIGALRDPNVQKGLGFLIALAKNLGGCMNKQLKQH